GEPALTAGGARTLRRGVGAARSSGRDDQLLPRLGQAVAEGSRSVASAAFGADAGHLGRARFLPRLRPRGARARRRTQPRPRGAPTRRVALGAPRRGGTRQPAAYRLLRPRGIGNKPWAGVPVNHTTNAWVLGRASG